MESFVSCFAQMMGHKIGHRLCPFSCPSPAHLPIHIGYKLIHPHGHPDIDGHDNILDIVPERQYTDGLMGTACHVQIEVVTVMCKWESSMKYKARRARTDSPFFWRSSCRPEQD